MNSKDFIEFAKIIGKLKRISRTGWKIRGVKSPESVADHIFRASVLGMIIADIKDLNKEKILRMLLLHDLEESISGDIDRLKKEKMGKKSREIGIKSVKSVLSKLPSNIRKKYFDLWKEYEEQKTEEARICRDIDKLEMMIQALEYENKQPSTKKDLEIFWRLEKIKNPYLKKIFEELKKERDNK